jgi:predicted small metal-binding protein
MARTLGCADVGYECVYRITTEDGNDDFILDATIEHAKKAHPEIAGNEVQLREHLRAKIHNLLQQAGYHPGAL